MILEEPANSKLAGSLSIRPKRSRYLIGITAIVHILSAVSLCGAGVSVNVCILGMIGIVCSLLYLWWNSRHKQQLEYTFLSEGEIKLTNGKHERYVRLLSSSVAWQHLVVLQWQEINSWRVTSRVLLPDSMSSEQWRRLQIWLRWQVLLAQ